jgi:tape measure domain-containing protein
MSSEVASGHVSIFPVMTGFRSRVTKGTQEAGAAGAKSFDRSFKGAGAATGRALGRDLKSALTSSAGDLGSGAMKKLTGEVASASSALARVRLKQQDDAGRVRVAETRLAEAIAKSGANSSQAVAAEERLASARRVHATTTDAVTAATSRLRASQASLRTAQDAVRASQDGAAASSGRFRTMLQGLGSTAATGFQSVVGAASRVAGAVGRTLGSGIQTAATGAVTVAAAGIGIALSKGFSRLGAIDTARAKLTGLGNDADAVKAIMGDALASVRGTSFGLGEAATVAAGAVAAGIKPGEQLQGTLKGIANVSAAAGTSMEETGAIFNKVASSGRAYTENLNQLADRGIPIYQALATQLGVTTDEVREMATRGEIDFATFSAAAATAAGTVADEMGKTVPGAAKNFFAAMGRIGANALEPIYGKIAPLILAATSALGPIEERAKAFGQVLLTAVGPALDWLTGLLERIGSGALAVSGGFSNLMGIAGPLTGIVAALGAGGFAGLLAKLGPLGALLPGLGAALAALASPLGIVGAALAGFALSGGDFSGLVTGITGIVTQIVSALPGMVAQIAQFIPALVDGILSQVPTLLSAGTAIVMVLVQGLVTAIPTIVSGAVALVQGLLQAIVANLPMIITGAIQLVTTLLQGIVNALPFLVSGALQLVDALLIGIVSALPLIIEGGVQLLLALLMGIVNALPQIIQLALDVVMTLLDTIVTALPMIIEAGIQLLLSLVTGLVEALPQLITAAIDLVIQLVTGLLKMLPRLIEAGITLVVSLIQGIVGAIPKIIAMLPQIIEAIWNGLISVDWLDLGVQIVQGIINGLVSMGSAVVDAIVDLASGAFEGFKDFFGIASPSKLMRRETKWVVAGSVLGIEDEAPKFTAALVGMAENASQRAQAAMGTVTAEVAATAASGSRTASGAGPLGGQVPGVPTKSVVMNITTPQTDARLQMRQWQREAEKEFASS